MQLKTLLVLGQPTGSTSPGEQGPRWFAPRALTAVVHKDLCWILRAAGSPVVTVASVACLLCTRGTFVLCCFAVLPGLLCLQRGNLGLFWCDLYPWLPPYFTQLSTFTEVWSLRGL